MVFAAIKSSSPPVVFSSSSYICNRCSILESSAKSIYLLTSILTFGSFYGLHLIISIIVRSKVASSKPGLSVKCTEQMLRDFRSLLQRWMITCDGKFVLVKSRCYNLLFSFRILVKSVVTNWFSSLELETYLSAFKILFAFNSFIGSLNFLRLSLWTLFKEFPLLECLSSGANILRNSDLSAPRVLPSLDLFSVRFEEFGSIESSF